MVKVLVTQDLVKTCADYSYGSHRGDSNYIAWLDLNNDGRIDAKDVGAIAARVGQTIDVPPDFQASYENTWKAEWYASTYQVTRYPDNRTSPAIPSEAEIRSAFEDKFAQALGAMVKACLDKGVSITLEGYSITAENRMIDRRYAREWEIETYQVHVTTLVQYSCPIPTVASPLAPIIAYGIAVGIAMLLSLLGLGGLYYLYNISHPTEQTHTSNLKVTNPSPNDVVVNVPVINPDGTISTTPITVPAGGTLDLTNIEKTTKAPENTMTQMIGYGIFAVCVIGGLAIFVPMLKRNGNRRKR